ncbi:MAG: zinc ribbon domain-containing protein [Thermoleophilia bacterium]|nr:zinc ribbon domain-containing protein [Thermoleophilia bacterium]
MPLEVYEKTLAIREARRRRPQAGRPPRVPLTGRHVRCGTCGGRLYARYQRKPTVLYYSCKGRKLGLCERGVAMRGEELTPHVEERFFQRLKRAHAPRARPSAQPIGPLREAVDQVEQALGRLASMYAEGELLQGEYRAARELQLKRREKAERKLERAVGRTEDMAQADAIDQTWEDLGR